MTPEKFEQLIGQREGDKVAGDKTVSKDRKGWLARLLAEGESETVELKESLDREALETIAAFANTRGGALLIGVRDDGTVRGITLGKESLREWANHIAQATHLHPRIGSLSYEVLRRQNRRRHRGA